MNKNKIILSLALVSVISTSVFAGKLKGKVTTVGDKGMLSVGGGTNTGGASTGLLRFDANVFVPVYTNQFMSVGFNTGANYNSFNYNFQTLPTVYNMANQVTNTAAFVGDVSAKNNGFTLQVGPQANFYVGNRLIISPILGLGLTNLYSKREYAAVQTTNVNGELYTYNLLKVKQNATSGLCMTPKVRLNYMISPVVGIWTEAIYMISPSVSTQISTFKPEGAANEKGYYEDKQLAFGTYTTQTLTQSYNAVGINVGITLVLGGGNSERKGINEGGLKKTEGMTNERKGWDGTVKGGSIQEKGIQESGIKKTEETSAERKGWDGTVKGGSIQEKGIQESGIKKTEENTTERKGWDGTVKGGSIQEKGINQAGIKRTNDGLDANLDGLTYSQINDQEILIQGIDINGIPFEHTINTNGTGGTTQNNEKKSPLYESQNKDVENPLYKSNNNLTKNPLYESKNKDGDNPLYKSQNSTTSSCGSVTQKTTYPDGKVEELTFACPADAAEYQQIKNVTVSNQPQGTQGKAINKAGIKKNEEAPAERKGWDGTVKGGSIQEKEINEAGIKKTEEMPAERKGWDGSVKGSSKGINEKGLK